MKKTYYSLFVYCMKIGFYITFIQIVLLSTAIAAVGNAQVKKLDQVVISIDLNRASLEEAFKAIEQSTDYKFAYDEKVLMEKKSISFSSTKISVKDVLLEISRQANVSFLRVNNKIEVKKVRNLARGHVAEAAPDLDISGKVTDENGQGLPGATILMKGTTNGTTTDQSGDYQLSVPEDAILIVSYVGYLSKEVVVNNQSIINVSLMPDLTQLDELVVTALGVERQRKALGYATQQIKGENIVEARETNLVNSLVGRVAGAQITNSNGAIGASSSIILRGYNSVSGNNQPLFVIDGVPISNETHQSSRVFGGPSNPNQSGYFGEGQVSGGEQQVDYGNAAGEINPNDIESIQVLKGANAAALYGARAANGVILITMKNGKGQKGLGVNINSSVSFQTPLKTPEFQTEFGKGNNGLYSFPDVNPNAGKNFGPRFEGQTIPQYDPNDPSNPRSIPWINRLGSDPIGDFLETGVTQSYGFSVTNGNDNGNFRLSYTRLDQKGMVPNTDLLRNNLGLSASYSPSSKMTVSANMNYTNSSSDNRPNTGAKSESNVIFTLLKLGTNERLSELKNYWEPFREGVQQATADNRLNNPYFLVNENLNSNRRDRMFGNVSFSYDILDNLTVRLRTGRDFYSDRRKGIKAFSHRPYFNGLYRQANIVFQEDNTDILLTYNTELGTDFSLSVNGGANRFNQRIEESRASTGDGLVVPGLYNLSNSRSAVSAQDFLSRKRINSVYGSAQLGYRDYLFIDVSARNDWSSALPSGNNSYFYPSVSLSAIVSDMFDFHPTSESDFVKARASYAQVGNDTNPYQTGSVTISGGTSEGISINSVEGKLGNVDLRPEEIDSYEVGLEGSFFSNRVGFDVTYYSITNNQQIATIPLATESGFLERVINIPAEIRNKGVELSLNIDAIRTNNFSWNLGINWAKNSNKIRKFSTRDDQERITLLERWINLDIREGGSFGDFYGDYLLKVDENGNLGREGLQIYRADGRAEESDDVGSLVDEAKPLLGNAIPDWIAGIQNTFTYKGFTLGFLFDINKGGELYSRTYVLGNQLGALQESATIVLRDDQAARDAAIADGKSVVPGEHWVILNGASLDKNTGDTEATTIAARTENFFKRYYDNDDIGTFDRTFVKLRELRLTYNLSQSLLDKLPLQRASISFFGRNLALWDNVPHIDPEVAGYSGDIPGGEYFAIPSARSFGFDVNLKF